MCGAFARSLLVAIAELMGGWAEFCVLVLWGFSWVVALGWAHRGTDIMGAHLFRNRNSFPALPRNERVR